jgi:Tol biopolymer transport system component
MAADLVPGDTNDLNDVFVHDRQAGTTERVSVTAGGAQATGTSNGADISADGRYVAFATTAGNLSPSGAIGSAVVVRDRATGSVTPVSVTEEGAGTQTSDEASISADGRYVAFTSFGDDLVPGDDEGHQDVFVRDLVGGTTQRLSVGVGGVGGDDTSRTPHISADGRHVAFVSDATNLVAGDTNGRRDAFVWDRGSGSLERVSTSLAGVEGNHDTQLAVTSDGAATVALATSAWNLVPGDGNFARDVVVRRTFGAG